MFRDQNVLITGPSSGIGKDLAVLFAREGAHLILVSRNSKKLEILKQDLQKEYGIRAHVIAKDLSLPGSAEELVKECRSRNLPVHFLINNAGFGIFGLFSEGKSREDVRMMELHLGTMVVLTHAFIPDMIRRGMGGVMTVASTAAFQPVPYLNVYSATKAFVVNFSLALAEEVRGSGVKITCLVPGSTETAFFDSHLMNGFFPPRVGRMASKVVARMGFEAFKAGKPLYVAGLKNRIQVFLSRLAPRALVIRTAKAVMSRKIKPS